MKGFQIALLMGFSFVCYHANAQVSEEQQQWVEQALSDINNNTDDTKVRWQYSQHTVMPDMTRVEQFNASLPDSERWILVSENGENPDKKRLQEYREHQQELLQDKDENTHELAFSDLINLSTLALVDEEGDSVAFTFTPNIDKLDNNALTGTIYLDKRSKQLRKILISNTDELNPAFSVTLTKFELELGFDVFEGLVMPAHTSTIINGTAAIFKSLDSIHKVTYSEYKILDKPQT
ncbi:hypothetical protein [Shewanella litoralis]|uniref:Uncharacterized protein n=1 Tax=Shewanella litoralis TaxID=2282700 RepID=A0ABQ2RIT4_9GAMM|nr:hypothetical protein [Shewanella litoralis]GGQ34557.1 hypothetical protein GCM10009411_37410 [Shewanella litoralis]